MLVDVFVNMLYIGYFRIFRLIFRETKKSAAATAKDKKGSLNLKVV